MPEPAATQPPVTVLLPVYNGEQHLGEAIKSVLAQTYGNFRLLVIDDGSTDSSAKIAGAFADERIQVERNSENTGLSRTLNRGLDMAESTYLARIDCDDICVPDRLEKQVAFMQRYPDVGVCGSYIETIGNANRLWKFPCDHESIRCRMLFAPCIAHPSAIMRMQAVNRHRIRYDTTLERAQDYDFWTRCSTHMQLANYPEALVKYRLHGNQTGSLDMAGQQKTADLVRRRLLGEMGVDCSAEDLAVHHALATLSFPASAGFTDRAAGWLGTLAAANERTASYPEPEFRRELAHRLYRACYTSKRGMRAWATYRNAPFTRHRATPPGHSLKLLLRCLVDHARH